MGKGVFAGLHRAVDTGINFAHRITQVVGHGVIGGLRAIRNGGKFLTGFITGGVGKLVTIGTGLINDTLKSNPFAQGLVVATAGGLASVLAGGSFEMGFMTAGLAFATNELISRGFGSINSVPKAQRGRINEEMRSAAKGHRDGFETSRKLRLSGSGGFDPQGTRIELLIHKLRQVEIIGIEGFSENLSSTATGSYLSLPANAYGVAAKTGLTIWDRITGVPDYNYSVAVTVDVAQAVVSVTIFQNHEPIVYREF